MAKEGFLSRIFSTTEKGVQDVTKTIEKTKGVLVDPALKEFLLRISLFKSCTDQLGFIWYLMSNLYTQELICFS